MPSTRGSLPADHPRVQPNRAPSPSQPVLPSVAQLGALIRATNGAYHDFMRQIQDRPKGAVDPTSDIKLEAASELADDREHALRALAVTLPAVTMADVAVQLGLAERIQEQRSGHEAMKESDRALDRIFASVLPIVCAAAGLRLDQVGDEGLANRCASRMSVEVPA